MENTKEIIKPRRYNPREKEIGYKVNILYDKEYSYINKEGIYSLYLYAKVYYFYKWKFLGFTFNRYDFICYCEINDYFKGKYFNIKDEKISEHYLIRKILKNAFKIDKIMSREEVNKFLYLNKFWKRLKLTFGEKVFADCYYK